jgi:hypothetical protein
MMEFLQANRFYIVPCWVLRCTVSAAVVAADAALPVGMYRMT